MTIRGIAGTPDRMKRAPDNVAEKIFGLRSEGLPAATKTDKRFVRLGTGPAGQHSRGRNRYDSRIQWLSFRDSISPIAEGRCRRAFQRG